MTYYFYLGSRDKLLITIIVFTNFTTIKKLFWNTSLIKQSQNHTSKTNSKPSSALGPTNRLVPDQVVRHFVGPSRASSVTLQDQNPKFQSLDLKSKPIIEFQNVSLTWNPRRSVLKPSKSIIESQKLPKFILIGVMKCGTGAMSHFMNFHPSVSEPGFR